MAATNKRKSGKAAKKKAPKRKSPPARAAGKKKKARAKPPTKKKAGKSAPKSKSKTRKVGRAKKKHPSITAPAVKAVPNRTTTPVHMIRARFTEPLRRASEYENVRALIKGQALKLGSRTFLIHEDDGREYSFEKLDEYTTRFANLLADLGAEPGQRVALIMSNSPDFAFAFLGAMKGGYVAVPLNTQQSLETISFALKDCAASFVVTDKANLGRVREVTPGMDALKAVLVAGGGDDAAPNHTGKLDKKLPVIDLRGGMEAAGDGELRGNEPGWWDEAQIVYTSHDSGNPNGAVLQHRQFITAARWLSIWLNLEDEQRFMSALPLFHANAQIVTLFTPLTTGGSVVLSREFNVSRVWKAVERYHVTTLSAVPSMLGILTDRELSEVRRTHATQQMPWPVPIESPGTLKQRDDAEARDRGLARAHDISSLERVICGAAPLPAAVQKAFEKCFLVPVIEGLSMSETTCFAAINPGNGTRKVGSVGVAVGSKIAIQDDKRPPKPLDEWHPTNLLRMSPAVFPTADIDEPGEICVWGENVLREYLNRPELNPKAFAGGWYHSGNVGKMDCDGFVYVLGDKDDMIDLGAERLMPREVDELLFAHDKVENVATVGSGEGKGSLVTTWVVMRKGTFPGGPEDGRMPASDQQAQVAETEIVGYLAGKLPEKKRPSTIIFAQTLPQDVAGKTRVIELKRLLERRKSAQGAK